MKTGKLEGIIYAVLFALLMGFFYAAGFATGAKYEAIKDSSASQIKEAKHVSAR